MRTLALSVFSVLFITATVALNAGELKSPQRKPSNTESMQATISGIEADAFGVDVIFKDEASRYSLSADNRVDMLILLNTAFTSKTPVTIKLKDGTITSVRLGATRIKEEKGERESFGKE